MGCLESRPDLNYEEAAMVNGEYQLIYTEHHFDKYFHKLTSLAQGEFLTKDNFNAYASELSLQHRDPKASKVYEKFLKDDKYELKPLVVLAAILSRGSLKSKVEGIFQVYKGATSGLFGKPTFKKFFDLVFELCVVELLKLASPPDSSNNYKKDDFDNYVKWMHAGKEECYKEIENVLFVNKKTSVDLEQFLQWAQTDDNEKWFSSITVRKTLKHKGRHILHEHKKKAKESESGHHHESESKVSAEVKVGGFEAEVSVEKHHSHHEHHKD